MWRYLDAAARTGRPQVAAIGVAQEFQALWTAGHRSGQATAVLLHPGRPPGQRVLRLHLDEQSGPGFIKICSSFPYPVKA